MVPIARAADLTYQTRMENFFVALRARHWLYHIRSFLLEIASLFMTEIADSLLRWSSSSELFLRTTTHTYFVFSSHLLFFIITIAYAG